MLDIVLTMVVPFMVGVVGVWIGHRERAKKTPF